jgi:glycine/D-amino acid oxidase-like deaminating enzyme
MTDPPARASAVVIGAGIVGNSLVHHLALLGWKDIVLVDKGPLPNPGGSTGHASNFIFPIEYSRLMFELTRDSCMRSARSPRAAASRSRGPPSACRSCAAGSRRPRPGAFPPRC